MRKNQKKTGRDVLEKRRDKQARRAAKAEAARRQERMSAS